MTNTNWKHFKELKGACLTASMFGIDEARDVIATKQLWENYHQQNSPEHHQQIYTLSQKSISDIFDCNLKTNYQILIIFGTNISDTTIQLTTSPNVCFCNTWGEHNA